MWVLLWDTPCHHSLMKEASAFSLNLPAVCKGITFKRWSLGERLESGPTPPIPRPLSLLWTAARWEMPAPRLVHLHLPATVAVTQEACDAASEGFQPRVPVTWTIGKGSSFASLDPHPPVHSVHIPEACPCPPRDVVGLAQAETTGRSAQSQDNSVDAPCREPGPGVNQTTASCTPFPGVALAHSGWGKDERNLSTGIPELSWFFFFFFCIF